MKQLFWWGQFFLETRPSFDGERCLDEIHSKAVLNRNPSSFSNPACRLLSIHLAISPSDALLLFFSLIYQLICRHPSASLALPKCHPNLGSLEGQKGGSGQGECGPQAPLLCQGRGPPGGHPAPGPAPVRLQPISPCLTLTCPISQVFFLTGPGSRSKLHSAVTCQDLS